MNAILGSRVRPPTSQSHWNGNGRANCERTARKLQARIVKLKLDTANREPIDFEAESGKFRDAWHHAAGARGVAAAPRRQKAAA